MKTKLSRTPQLISIALASLVLGVVAWILDKDVIQAVLLGLAFAIVALVAMGIRHRRARSSNDN